MATTVLELEVPDTTTVTTGMQAFALSEGGEETQLALFVAPVLVLASFVLGPGPMPLVFNGFELGAVPADRRDAPAVPDPFRRGICPPPCRGGPAWPGGWMTMCHGLDEADAAVWAEPAALNR